MRIISLVVAFCFSLNVMASTGTVQELEKHLDDFHYALNVEWDQKDPVFYENESKKFFSKMEELIAEGKINKLDVLNLLEKKINSKEVVDAVKLKMSLLSNANSAEDLTKLIRESANEFYAQGASWNGHVVFSVAISIVLIGALAYSIWWDANHECVAWDTQYICTTQNNCSIYIGYDGYSSTYNGTYCGPSYSNCGYTDVCTQYQKK